MIKEKLSALADGELAHHEQSAVLSLLKADPDLQATWQCYHLISNILQRKSVQRLNPFNLGLSARVQASMAKEAAAWGTGFDMPIVMNTTHSMLPSSYKKCD